MNNQTKWGISNFQIRKKENWFKELLYKLHILKPKWHKVESAKEIRVK